MRIRTNHRTTHTLTTDAGVDVELAFEPIGDPLVHETDDTVVVAYMVHDSDCENPMTSNCGEGVLYMKGTRRSRSDDLSEIYGALGLDSDGTPDIDAEFPAEAPWVDYKGIQQSRTTLRDLAAEVFLVTMTEDQKQSWGHGDVIDPIELRRDLVDSAGVFCDEIDTLAVGLYPNHWRTFAGPYVVPVASYNEGRVGVTTWDGDIDDLPDGVWVACASAAENIRSQHLPEGVSIGWRGALGSATEPLYAEVTHNGVQVFTTQPEDKSKWALCVEYVEAICGKPSDATLLASAIKYSHEVLEQYSAWAEGECFMCTVEVFVRIHGGWIDSSDSRSLECSGFIGRAYAEETLRTEFFEPAVAGLST